MKVFAEYYKGLRKLILGENFWHIVISVVSGVTNLIFYILIAVQVFTGKIMIGDYDFLPCTPAGVMALLEIGVAIGMHAPVPDGTGVSFLVC